MRWINRVSGLMISGFAAPASASIVRNK